MIHTHISDDQNASLFTYASIINAVWDRLHFLCNYSSCEYLSFITSLTNVDNTQTYKGRQNCKEIDPTLPSKRLFHATYSHKLAINLQKYKLETKVKMPTPKYMWKYKLELFWAGQNFSNFYWRGNHICAPWLRAAVCVARPPHTTPR